MAGVAPLVSTKDLSRKGGGGGGRWKKRGRRATGAAAEAACCCLLAPVFEMMTITTWLILPVVICLSQRLSHACVSTRQF